MSGNSSDYTKYLPATLQADELIDRFLLAFEQILTGSNFASSKNPGIIERSSSNPPGLEAVIGAIHTYFDSDLTPEAFLPWLANWVALSLRDDWQTPTKREFIKQIVPLYRLRGTKEGLKRVLSLYLTSVGFPPKVTIYQADDFSEHQEDYFPEHYFQVELTLPKTDDSRYWQEVRIAKAIIDLEKPAHTYYGLKILVPSMQITGQIYPLNLKSAGDIAVNVKKPASVPIRLSIKSGFGQAEPYISTMADSLAYTVPQEQFVPGDNWYLIVDNLSNKYVSISLSDIHTMPITVQVMENIYSLNLTKAGDITVNVTKKSESTSLKISIKSDGQAEPYISAIADSLTYTVTQEQFDTGKNWHLIVDNLSNNSVSILLSIHYPDGHQESQEFSLSPGLQPGLKIYDKKNADGTVDKQSGNTFLGTQSGGN